MISPSLIGVFEKALYLMDENLQIVSQHDNITSVIRICPGMIIGYKAIYRVQDKELTVFAREKVKEYRNLHWDG